jgi:hypothetical protein
MEGRNVWESSIQGKDRRGSLKRINGKGSSTKIKYEGKNKKSRGIVRCCSKWARLRLAASSVRGTKVAVELELIRWWVEAAEDGVDERPEVAGVFEGGLEDALGSRGEVCIGFFSQKF